MERLSPCVLCPVVAEVGYLIVMCMECSAVKTSPQPSRRQESACKTFMQLCKRQKPGGGISPQTLQRRESDGRSSPLCRDTQTDTVVPTRVLYSGWWPRAGRPAQPECPVKAADASAFLSVIRCQGGKKQKVAQRGIPQATFKIVASFLRHH